MVIFPSVTELIIPNMNITTLWGIILIITAILGIYFNSALKTFGLSIKIIGKTSLILFLTGIILVWGVSMFQDFISTQGGSLIFWGIVLITVIGILLFWNPKTQNGKIKFEL